MKHKSDIDLILVQQTGKPFLERYERFMSQSANRHQAERWLQPAEEDLRAAQTLLDHEIYAQACLYAQQSGEKAVKALWYVIDADSWGHSVQRLITEFPRQADIPDRDGWIRHDALLDQFYSVQILKVESIEEIEHSLDVIMK
jgi:HEPN domain-containing protein